MSDTTRIQPLADRVVVSVQKSTSLPSGIIIPDTASSGEKPMMGIVVAIGPGKLDDGKRVPISVSIGDEVVFSKYSPDEILLDGNQYFILREESLLAIIKK